MYCMSKKALAFNWSGFVCLLMCMLLSGNVQAETPWLDSLYVRVADAEVLRPSGGDAVVVFNLEVFRPVKEWNNNDTTLGPSDFVFGKPDKDLLDIFKDVTVSSLHSDVTTASSGALRLEGRFVLGKLQISLTEVEGSTQKLALPYREWVQLCRVELPLYNPNTVELGLVWDKLSTGLISSNVPILEVLMDDLDKIPDDFFNFEDYATSQAICSGEEFFLFAHAVSSPEDDLKCTWQYSSDNGTTFTSLNNYAPNWGNATGGAGFQYRIQGKYSDTLWLRNITTNLSGINFKCVAERISSSSEKRETPKMVLKILPEVKVALEGYASPADFQANLGMPGDTARHCPGETAKARVAFYGIESNSQLSVLKGMGGKVYVAYRWIDQLGGTGRDTLKVDMAEIATQNVQWNSGFVLTSDKLQLNLVDDGKYYIHKVWTDSCSLGTVLTNYDTVVVKQSSNVVYEFDPIEYVAGSGGIDVSEGLGITFSSIEMKSPSLGSVLGTFYDVPEGSVGTDTLMYFYNSGGCTVTAIRQVNVVSSKYIAIKVLLEGPYIAKADSMRCIHESYFPTIGENLVSPYADEKSLPKPMPKFNRGIVDWIYVEVWDYPPNGKGFGDNKKGKLIDSTSALLLSNGIIAGIDGKEYVSFDHLTNNDYYIIIKHRNHMSILSAEKVTFTGVVADITTVDFTQKMENAFDNSRPLTDQDPLKMKNGKCLMYGGELNGDGLITGSDLQIFFREVFSIGYNIADVSLDSQVNAVDQAIFEDNNGIYRKF